MKFWASKVEFIDRLDGFLKCSANSDLYDCKQNKIGNIFIEIPKCKVENNEIVCYEDIKQD